MHFYENMLHTDWGNNDNRLAFDSGMLEATVPHRPYHQDFIVCENAYHNEKRLEINVDTKLQYLPSSASELSRYDMIMKIYLTTSEKVGSSLQEKKWS